MKTITYQDNMQLWRMESAAEKAGYKKTDDCYWCQIFRNSETGGEFCTSREEDSTNDPAADLAKMLTPSATEEPAEAMRPIMDRLTALKAESIAEADPFGQSPADREIKAIAATLAAFGVQWYTGRALVRGCSGASLALVTVASSGQGFYFSVATHFPASSVV